MPRPLHPFVLGSAILLLSPLAMALGFGPSQTRTTLGQHLDFAATIVLGADETVSRDCVSAEVLAGETRIAPRNIRAVLESTRDPLQRVVRVTSSVVIDEPVVTIEVSVGCGSQLSRRFVSFVDPPSMQLAEAEVSETVPLRRTTRAADSQTAALADVARQADATRREAAGPSDDAPRAPRVARRATQTPRAVVVARADTAVVLRAPRARKPATSGSGAPRTALAAPPRGNGSRLRLDPPRVLAAAPMAASTPQPSIVTPTPPTPSTASLPPSQSVDPLLAQTSAALAAASRAPAASDVALADAAARDRVAALEAEMNRLRSETQATRDTVGALQVRLREAEGQRYRNGLVYALSGIALLAVLVAAGLWWLRPRSRARDRWFEAEARHAKASRLPAATAALGDPIPVESGSIPFTPVPIAPVTARASTRPAPLASDRPTTGWADVPTTVIQTTQPAAIGGLEVTTVLGPEMSRPPEEPSWGANASEPRFAGDLSMEELIDLEQQAEFFVVLGQDEAALSLLENYIHSAGGKSPLPYLQLLELHQRRSQQEAYEDVRDLFNERFHANAPDWSDDLHFGRVLEDYPSIVARLQSLWATPLSAMQVLDSLLFRRQSAEDTFDFPAYRELLFLYSIARELSGAVDHAGGDPGDTDMGDIDLLLPLDGGVSTQELSLVDANHHVVDLDVSRWPEHATAADLLSRPKSAARR